jgi:mono/diheme cytochrome c family protein/cytochrome bd-type quinol oxidase subunit 1
LNYPHWQLAVPGGMLIALIAVLHVFVSHFAVGGGFFLVLTESRARRSKDAVLLNYCRRHSRFFALLTLVFGAITGVGIWFTIGLVSPEATSTLIDIFVWAWAIEWVFFFVEIAAAIIYYKSWESLPARDHQIVGWIYFVAAWMSLFVINGIITFQLTPGRWLQTHNFWDGIFNPTFLPSLVARTAICVILAGIFGFITLPRQEGREKVARWAAQWIVAGAVVLPLALWWYFSKIPQFSQAYFNEVLIGVRHGVHGGIGFTLIALAIALVCGLWRPRWMKPPVVAVLVVCGLGMIGAGEYVREFIRKPWVIDQVIYANDLLATQVEPAQAKGVSHTANFLLTDDTNSALYGKNLFQMQCGNCHAVHGYRSMTRRADGWDAEFAADILQHLPMMHGVMPPYAGNEVDRKALGSYLAGLNPPWHLNITDANRLEMGEKVFGSRCGHCHTINGKFRPLRGIFEKQTPSQVQDMFPLLSGMSSDMPNFNAPDDQAQALAFYISHEANKPLPAGKAPAQMPTGSTQSQLMRPASPRQEVR